MRWLTAFWLFLLTVFLIGCGGGGGSSTGTTGGTDTFVKPKVVIAWAARSKSINGPASALSAVFVFHQASHAGGDISFPVDRSGPASGSSVTYTGLEDVRVGALNLTAVFYADTGAQGAVVGTASGSITLGSDGTVNSTIETVGTIATVEVPTGQSVNVGETKAILLGCRNGNGDLIAVSPASATWSVSSGATSLEFQSGDAHGLSVGTPEVQASVDGKTSPATAVDVVDPAGISVSVTPSTATISPSATQQFTATVDGTPNRAVTWSVVLGDGGSISATGLYTAPATTGDYQIKATSVANPAKFAKATIHVANVQVTVDPPAPTISRLGTQQFTAAVTGTTNHSVTWSVIGTGTGSVTTAGLYTAPDVAGTYTVRATSQADSSKHADATVTVKNATFQIIARNDNLESGLLFGGVTCMAADGQTLGGQLVTTLSGNSLPAYWRPSHGWLTLGSDLANVVSGHVSVINGDGTYAAGSVNGQNTQAYRWSLPSGAFERIKTRAGTSFPDPLPIAITTDGKVFGTENAQGFKWVSGGSTQAYSELATIMACSDDGVTVAGEAKLDGFENYMGSLWTQANGLDKIGGREFLFLAADGQSGIINDFGVMKYWSRVGGITSVPGFGVISMSRNGQYIVLKDENGVISVWTPGGASKLLSTIFAAAGAPADVDTNQAFVVFSNDGKTFAGQCKRPAPGGGTGTYAFYARLDVAP